MRGFFEIGIYRGKTPNNVGTLWRSASQMGAAGIFTVGKRPAIEKSVKTHLSKQHNQIAKAMVDGLVGSLKTTWNVRVDLCPKKEQ